MYCLTFFSYIIQYFLITFIDEWYATPLLTMTDEDEKAMKNKIFRRLLRKVGLKPPEDFNVVSKFLWFMFDSNTSEQSNSQVYQC